MASLKALTLQQRTLNNHEKKVFENVRVKHTYNKDDNNTTIHAAQTTGVIRNTKVIPYAAHYHINALLAMLTYYNTITIEPVIVYTEPYEIWH